MCLYRSFYNTQEKFTVKLKNCYKRYEEPLQRNFSQILHSSLLKNDPANELFKIIDRLKFFFIDDQMRALKFSYLFKLGLFRSTCSETRFKHSSAVWQVMIHWVMLGIDFKGLMIIISCLTKLAASFKYHSKIQYRVTQFRMITFQFLHPNVPSLEVTIFGFLKFFKIHVHLS